MKKITVLLIAFMMLSVPMASAVDTQSRPAVAQVTANSAPPVVEFKWELNDELPTSGIQVIPVPLGNKPVDIFAVISDPNGAADIVGVDLKVFYPLTVPNGAGTGLQNFVDGVLVSNIADVDAALNAAELQGRITAAQKALIRGHIVASEWKLFTGRTVLKYFDVSGDYTVEANPRDAGGSIATPLTNTFTYVSIKALGIDVQSIDYGQIIPGTHQIRSGDRNYADTAAPLAPTLRNEGNDPFRLVITATNLQGSNIQNIIPATQLDAKPYGVDSYAVVPDGFAALGNPINLNLFLATSPGVPFPTVIIPPDTWKPGTKIFTVNGLSRTYTGIQQDTGINTIDFSVDALIGTKADTYTGTITVQAVP